MALPLVLFAPLLPLLSGAANVLRIPALALFLGGLFGKLFTFFAAFLTKGVARQLTIITALAALTLGLIAVFHALIASVSLVVPSQYAHAVSMVVPSNAVSCFSIYVSSLLVRWVFVWQHYAIERIGSAN